MDSPKKLQDIKVAVDAVIFGYFDKKDQIRGSPW